MKFVSKWKKADHFFGRINMLGGSFKQWNMALAIFFAVQGCGVVLFAKVYELPINALFLTPDLLQTQLTHHTVMALAVRQLYMVNIAYLVTAYFLIAAIIHLVAATVYRTRYEAGIKKNMNFFRWTEYSITASITMIIISLLAGIYDFGSLLLIALLTIAMTLSLAFIEQRVLILAKRVRWLLCIILGCVSLAPWLTIAFYIISTDIFSTGHAAVYMYGIVLTAVVLFAAFVGNTYLLRIKKGNWANYAYGERCYMILSFLLKTLLAWQIFAAVLYS